jgi:hypothetical protein
MKLSSVYIPITQLRIGDIIKLPSSILPLYSFKQEFLVVDIETINNISLLRIIDNNARARIREISAPEHTCIELISWAQRPAVTIFAKDLEIGDFISPFGDDRGAQITSIKDDYSRATRHFSYAYETPVSGSVFWPTNSKQTISYTTALYSDIFFTPTKLLPEEIRRKLPLCSQASSEEYDAFVLNLSLLLESLVTTTSLTSCSFKLGSPCKHTAIYTNGKKSFCADCVRKIAVVAVYGDFSIISEYNRKIKEESMHVA